MDCYYVCRCTACRQLGHVSLFKVEVAVMLTAAFRCCNVLRHVLLERCGCTHSLYLTCDACCYNCVVDGGEHACILEQAWATTQNCKDDLRSRGSFSWLLLY